MHASRKTKDVIYGDISITNIRNPKMDKPLDRKQNRPALNDVTNEGLHSILGKIKPKNYAVTAQQRPKVRQPIVNNVKATVPIHQQPTAIPQPIKEEVVLSQGFVVSSQQSSSSEEWCLSPLRCTLDEGSKIKSEKSPPKLQYNDIDAENFKDITQVALYANDIFEYYKQREVTFAIAPYMNSQPNLTKVMRAILVDWLVEVQENFELNHETLYLSVKLIDIYLSNKRVNKELLQLLGACAVFIACKFDERCPPLIQDFLYICDDAYTRRQFLRMEISILKTIDFDLGIPISYRFLRRYAKCHRASLPLLTLSRYILELSLLDYSLISVRDSLLAASSLYLALRMQNECWTPTLEHYTGYTPTEMMTVAKSLNKLLHRAPSSQQSTSYKKYSHEVFHKVTQVPRITDDQLASSQTVVGT